MKKKIDKLTKNFVEWAEKRNIASGLSMHSQFVKLAEEAKEIAEGANDLYKAIRDNDKAKVKEACLSIQDGIGDSIVVASILARQYQEKDPENAELVSSNFFALAKTRKDEYADLVMKGEADTNADVAYFVSTPLNMLTSTLLINLGNVASDVARNRNPVRSLKLFCANLEVISSFLQFNLVDCLDMAWNAIKDRKGLVKNGVFVKFDDLTEEEKAQFN